MYKHEKAKGVTRGHTCFSGSQELEKISSLVPFLNPLYPTPNLFPTKKKSVSKKKKSQFLFGPIYCLFWIGNTVTWFKIQNVQKGISVKTLPSPVLNLLVPLPKVISVIHLFWIGIHKQLCIYILLLSETQMGSALYTFLWLAFFTWRLLHISI